MIVYEYRFTRHRIGESPATIRVPSDTLKVLQSHFRGAENERLVVVALNAKNHVIGTEVVYTGNVSASLVRVAEIFRFPIRLNASGIIIAHNHPTGDPTPSPDDLHLTAEILAASRILDIDLLDHIVVGEGDSYVSLRDRGVSFERPKQTAA